MMGFLIQSPLEYFARSTPTHPALSFKGDQLSYAELDVAANQLANTLLLNGAKAKSNIGIFHHKSLELGVAIYGILKAGCVFVPLDPFMPADRLSFIIEDCEIEHIIASEVQLPTLKQLNGSLNVHIYGVNTELTFSQTNWASIRLNSVEQPELDIIDDDLGYIMYTSGSTGKPKGMMHTHLGSITYARWGARHVKMKDNDRVASHAPLHFDLSIFDFFSTAQAGGTVVLVPEPVTRFPASWTKYIEDEQITVVFTVPYTLISMFESGAMEKRELGSLRWILFGGEPYPPNLLNKLMTALPTTLFSNVYGPAEAPSCTVYDLPGPPENDEPIPIGTVSTNSEDIIIDSDGNDCPIGVPGELCIRSTTLTRGYWKREDLNEHAFISRERAGVFPKMYFKTGDRVLRNKEGLLVFLGRVDRLIKTRGQRVELGEVESVLAQHEVVLEAAAYTVDDSTNSKEIRAAVLISQGTDIDENKLITFAKSKLPPYAVPTKIMLSDSLPRTSTGKIDRNQLSESLDT